MKTITERQSQRTASRSLAYRAKSFNKSANGFTKQIKTKTLKSSDSFLFNEELQTQDKTSRFKLMIRSKAHLKSILLAKRAAYLTLTNTMRSTKVMHLIQSLATNLKQDSQPLTRPCDYLSISALVQSSTEHDHIMSDEDDY